MFFYYSRDLPSFKALEDYRPPLVSRVYDRSGAPVAEFFHERRTLVPAERIPKVLKQAVIAADRTASHGEVIHIIDVVKQEGILKFALNIDSGA